MKRVSELVAETKLRWETIAEGKKRLYLCTCGLFSVRQVGTTESVRFAQKAVIDLRKIGGMGV